MLSVLLDSLHVKDNFQQQQKFEPKTHFMEHLNMRIFKYHRGQKSKKKNIKIFSELQKIIHCTDQVEYKNSIPRTNCRIFYFADSKVYFLQRDLKDNFALLFNVFNFLSVKNHKKSKSLNTNFQFFVQHLKEIIKIIKIHKKRSQEIFVINCRKQCS